MSFTAGSGSLKVTAPPNSNIAPPGYYMLFLLNSSGAPSLATFVQVNSAASTSGISFVQANSGPSTIQPTNTSVSVAYSNTQTAGNLNVVAIGWGDTVSAISSVTDTKGNTYTRAAGPTSTTGVHKPLLCQEHTVGSNTVTVKFNQSAAYPDVVFWSTAGWIRPVRWM